MMNDENKELNEESGNSEIEKLKNEAQENLAGWKRAQADFINFKKDEEKRIESVLKFGNEALLLEFLDEIDNFETALIHAPDELTEKYRDWFGGIEQVKRGFMDMLSRHGIERIQTQGEKFDPSRHEAVSGEGDEVREEVRAGYILNGKVIRPARVKV